MITEENKSALKVSRPELAGRRLYVTVDRARMFGFHKPRPVLSSINLTGFEADSIDQAESYALTILEACCLARQEDAEFMRKEYILTISTEKEADVVNEFADRSDYKVGDKVWHNLALGTYRALHKYEVQFDGLDNVKYPMANMSDAEVERVWATVVKTDQAKGKINPFTVFDNGEEVAGG